MDTKNIYERIKKARVKPILTNCYTMEVIENSRKLWCINDDFVFFYEDHGINRLVYFAQDWKAVDKLLQLVHGGTYYLEFMTRDPDEYVPKDAGLTARMMRLANPNCQMLFENSAILQYRDTTIGYKAKEKDAEEIHAILWSMFHTEISHLLTAEELRNVITQGKITIHKNNIGQIDAILQADVMPKKFYINQIINKGEKSIIHAILINRLEEYVACGGKYLYAWVEDKNIVSQKFHGKYGMFHDGMWSMIYCVEK